MKRIITTLVLCIALICTMGISISAAKPDISPSVVKTDMVIHTDTNGSGTVIGSADLNRLGDGRLHVVIKLQNALSTGDNRYDVRIWFGSYSVSKQVLQKDCLKVNSNGNGNANIRIDIPSGCDSLPVSIEVRPDMKLNVDGGTTPCYVNGPSWQTLIAVPSK